MIMPSNRWFPPAPRKVTGADAECLLMKTWDALAERRPPGEVRLVVDGVRPVVWVRKFMLSRTPVNDLKKIFGVIGEPLDTWTHVLWPLDVARKLATEELGFEFDDVVTKSDRWRVE